MRQPSCALIQPMDLGTSASGVTLPERGIHDDTPAEEWSDGFLTGNGEFGAILYGGPAHERTVLNHHRLVLPNGTRDLLPPVTSGHLETARDLALQGDYAGANREFSAGWERRWTQTYHPAYELCISSPAARATEGYRRTTDFRSGEVSSRWADADGTWTRRAFVSRADRVVVHELLPAPGRTVDVTLSVDTDLGGPPSGHAVGGGQESGMDFTALATASGDGSGHLNLRAVYPAGQGAFGYEGLTRVEATGGTLALDGVALSVTGASRVVLLTKLDRYETADAWEDRSLHTQLAALAPDYDALLARHTAVHSALYDRSRLRLDVPEADRRLSTSELLARQNADRDRLDLALLERLYDSGRYFFLSSSGVLPPRLTGIWTGSWTEAWAGDFTTDANINLQVAGGSILDLTETMRGYFDLVLGQLGHWRTNARRLYGARGFLAPSRTDGEYGLMLHFEEGDYPCHCWTGGADWLLYPLLEYVEVTGDEEFLRDELGPALFELALFYEDFLTRTDRDGSVVFVPSFSMENRPGSTDVAFSINATGDIAAGRHALGAAIDVAEALGVEQGEGEGVERWSALLARLPEYAVNERGALAEWSWPGLTDAYDHRHIHHLYAAWPLHEINPEDRPDLVPPALRALELRGDENLSGHGSLHRALAAARLKDSGKVHENLLKILGNDMVHRSLMTSHYPDRLIYNADVAHALPAVLSEALLYTRPGVLELLPALPSPLVRGSITGLRARGRIRVHELSWDVPAGTAELTVTSDIDQDVELICRHAELPLSVTTTAGPAPSVLGPHARTLYLTAGERTTIAVRL